MATTTESIMNCNLTVHDHTDNMEMGTSPFPIDDIEFDLEDDAQYADDNSMLDDAPASIDLMQADGTATQPDEQMNDEHVDEEIVFEDADQQIDHEMNAGEQDHVETYDFEIENQQDSYIPVIDDNKTEEQGDQQDIAQPTTDEAHDPDLVDEDDTNHQFHSTAELDQHAPGNATDGDSADATLLPYSITNDPDAALQENSALDDAEASSSIETSEEKLPLDATTTEDIPKSVESDHIDLVIEPQYIPEETAAEEEATNDFMPPRSPTPAEIHPVTVDYAGTMYFLFPSPEQDSETIALLDDPALALGPVNDLLKELHKPVADFLGHEDEIVLDIHSLGLHICEDSKYAKELKLSDIIDIYMMLSQNQALGHIEPLHCHLSHRTCLQTQMQYLVNSARGGKTYAEIVQEHIGSPDEHIQQEGDTFEDVAEAEVTAEDVFEDENDELLPTLKTQTELAVEEDADAENFLEDENHEAGEDYLGEPDNDEAPDATQQPQQAVEDVAYLNGELAEKDVTQGSISTVTDEPVKALEADDETVANDEEEELEDLFADGSFDEEAAELEENSIPGHETVPEATKTSPHSGADDDFDFDEWDKEAALEDAAKVIENAHTDTAPVTPSKSLNSKRKAEEDEEEFELEFTPQAKKTRSS